MIYKQKFYIWLIDTLNTEPLTLKQIQTKWHSSSANIDETPLTERSFNRYRRDAEMVFNLDIKCDKAKGNVYYLVYPADKGTRILQDWLLSSYRISSLASRINQHNQVVLEHAPPASELLQTIMDTIDNKQNIHFKYQSHYSEMPREIAFIPVFVRLFKQHWYVIGEVIGKNYTMVCALERISDLTISPNKKRLTSKLAKILKPEIYFEHCFGIIRKHEPIHITIRAFWPQNLYLNDTPLHHSQTIVDNSNDNFTDYEIFVRPTYDLKQELLWLRDKIAVLSPKSFRNDMIAILEATTENYKTGDNHVIDE